MSKCNRCKYEYLSKLDEPCKNCKMCMCNESDGWVIYCESPGGVTYRLGIYSTKEKALKVLDEIQRIIEYPGSSLISPTALQNYYRLSSTGQIYQMPQDEDVEV